MLILSYFYTSILLYFNTFILLFTLKLTLLINCPHIIITNPKKMLNLTQKLIQKLSTTITKIPELESGNQQCLAGKFRLAEGYFQRAVEIATFAKLDQRLSDYRDEGTCIYVDAVAKLAACHYLHGKYTALSNLIQPVLTHPLNIPHYKYLLFLSQATNSLIPTLPPTPPPSSPTDQHHQIHTEIKQLIQTLLSKQPNISIQGRQYRHVPILGYIGDRLNNRGSYKKMLVSLVERSPKSQKLATVRQDIASIGQVQVSSEIELLHHMATILQNKPLTTADKQFINSQVNKILQTYEQSRPAEIYKALLDLIMSLIGQKHYMSAEGMIGYLKTEQSPLLAELKTQDRNLIANLYRMLVTRANNQGFQVGWAKEEPVLFGDLVVERVIKAALLGHPIDKLIH